MKNMDFRVMCNICNHRDAVAVFSGPDRLMRLPGTFQVVRCSHCGVFYQWPRLPWDQLQAYYQGDYDSYVRALSDDPSLLRRLIRRIYTIKMRRFVERFHTSGTLLDIGCGTGSFLEEMQMSGKWRLHAVEPTSSAAIYVRERFGIPVINERIELVSLPERTFDVVTMWNVFEHLEDPKLTVQKVYRSLKQDGIVIVAVPNYESISRVVFGRYWCGWDLPRHLFVFPRTTLIWLFKQNGFTVLDSKCFIGSHAIFGHSLAFLHQDLAGIPRMILGVSQKIFLSFFGRLLFYPFQRIIEFSGLSSITIWVFQKV
jgi:2-polyprenyl-3-methyl-5-hydroxy-6-metoxy-1,4-benzoquinol methylase